MPDLQVRIEKANYAIIRRMAKENRRSIPKETNFAIAQFYAQSQTTQQAPQKQ